MNGFDVILLVILLCCAVGAVAFYLRRRGHGSCAGCGGNCGSCALGGEARRGVVIAGYLRGTIAQAVELEDGDLIVCADRGYDYAVEEKILPDCVVGDFDSATRRPPEGLEVVTLPSEKDETDTYVAVSKAVESGCGEVVIVGGLGGRLDHTVANLQTLARFANRGIKVRLQDCDTTAFLLGRGERVRIPEGSGVLSVFSYSDRAVVSERGVKYPLHRKRLTSAYPLGVSNEIEGEAEIVCHSGRLLLLLERSGM